MVLDQIQGIFNEVLYKEVVALHSAAQPYVRTISEGFTFPRPLNDVLWRCALRKGHDCLGAILQLVQEKKSGISLPLLRPMCEDLLYLCYFEQLTQATANKLIYLGAQRETLQSLLAQANGDGNAAWVNIGAAGRPPIEESLGKVEAELAKEGKSLGWRNGSYWPSASHVAQKTGLKFIYDQIYHGTSREVHFSPHHLLRMVWGTPSGPHTATLENFERYYEAYALSNAGWLFCALIAHCWKIADVEPEESLNDLVVGLVKTLGDFGRVPIVTAEELAH